MLAFWINFGSPWTFEKIAGLVGLICTLAIIPALVAWLVLRRK